MMDSKGVVYKQRGDELPHHKQQVAREDGPDIPHTKELKDVVAHVKPHALIGLTGRGPAFTEVHSPDTYSPSLLMKALDLFICFSILLRVCRTFILDNKQGRSDCLTSLFGQG